MVLTPEACASVMSGSKWKVRPGVLGRKLGEYTLVCSLSPLPGRLDAPLLPT